MSTQTSEVHNIKAKSHILSLLGDELIGSDSLAIFELVKNAYDADAEEVVVKFIDLSQDCQKIIIEDDGHGMTGKIIDDVWLTIGTDFKRGKNRKESKKFKRVSFGNKGVGRLAVHKLAKKIVLETQAEGENSTSRLTIDWAKLIASEEFIQDLKVDVENFPGSLFPKNKGTRIILDNLTTKVWTKKTLKDLVRKIESIKNPFYENPNFQIKIEANDFHQEWIDEVTSADEVLNDSLYKFCFKIKKGPGGPTDFAKYLWRYSFNPPSQIRLSKGRARNKETTSFHIGELFKDLDGVDTYNRYLRNKDLDKIGAIKGQFYVFNQSSAILNPSFGGQVLAVKQFIKDNAGIKIFRDNIRVYNYGEPYDDWLGLDLDKIQRTGDHFGKKVTIGAIELELKSSNDGLIEKTNREGFIDNVEFNRFQQLSKEVFNFFEQQAAKDKDLVDEYLEGIKPIKKVGFSETIKELEEKIKEKNLERDLEPLLKRVDRDYTEMRDIMINSGMTGLNLGIAFHEVDREIRFINADLNATNVDISLVKDKVRNLIQILESLSPILRQNKSSLSSAKKVIEIARRRNENRFRFHKVVFSSPVLTGESGDFNFRVPTNLLISAISNIIDNSIYWTRSKIDLFGGDLNQYRPAIFIGTDLLTFEGPAIILCDNGPGFSSEPEYLAQPFKTKKEGGMGLGLYFADLVMNMIGGKMIFPDSSDLDIPKAYDGACIALIFPK
ncbi:ATP-binding protein [Dyadobacter chenwenxiniae]|uniref:ATP-binding protein n=1 Tax=Dyadobacter chenwenxiniae TaxID=2906456 RepID=A0A9X1PMX2_9BACT|nr:ATP-binding protein [Dyadobacter chenwenxiniae]MCF0061371.1 ATP-binding protein [Dyadobacter chenwenxiniae]UON81193.1 ATP-binding protein [Dyadobacter chenwenxiniae]